ncbi:BnaA01g07670D [Brassica napus]|uniref:BnaA01g07670D protein n=1 Tax=Brassica napus TaxID=3708 RepID=A0A078IHL7_BRANA|nr:BnaA01g07670D [Brassica napus]
MTVLCGLLVNPRSTVAAMGVLIQTTSFAVSSRVGNELGANRPKTAKLSAMLSIVFAAATGVTAAAFAYSSVHRRRRDSPANGGGASDFGLVRDRKLSSDGGLRCREGDGTTYNINLGAFYLVGMPVAVGLGFWAGIGFNGLWLGLLAAQISCAGLMLYVVGTTNWVLEAEKAQTLTCAETVENDLIKTVANTIGDDGESDEAQPLIRITVLY